jgi:hypothetical protein
MRSLSIVVLIYAALFQIPQSRSRLPVCVPQVIFTCCSTGILPTCVSTTCDANCKRWGYSGGTCASPNYCSCFIGDGG